ncbi:MAG: type II secretion system protein [Desulfuromusa sp.]|nr:type II secretion system protein [Desulfuromusa sp.]
MLQRSCFERSGYPQLNNQRGAVLLMVLVSVTLLGLLSGIAGSSWQTIVQRAKEADLLWKGNQIRQAIGSYYTTSRAQGAAPKAFPSELDSLLKDPRFLETKRHLRRLYPDPMTGEDWGLIMAPGGRIIGVKSSSDKEPFKQDDFAAENKSFAGQQRYSDWQFIYQPEKKAQAENSPPTDSNPSPPAAD